MRAAAIPILLLACGPSRASRPCPAAPGPAAEAFTTCGGMLYHTPPGGAARYAIQFVNKLGPRFELRDVCILLDGMPLFTAKDIEAAPKDVKWNGRVSYAQHRVQVQVVYAEKGAADTLAVRAARDVAAIDGGSLELAAIEQGAGVALRMSLPSDTPEPRCDH